MAFLLRETAYHLAKYHTKRMFASFRQPPGVVCQHIGHAPRSRATATAGRGPYRRYAAPIPPRCAAGAPSRTDRAWPRARSAHGWQRTRAAAVPRAPRRRATEAGNTRDCAHRTYSRRKTCIGSSLAARIAGKNDAANDTRSTIATTPASVAASHGDTP